MSKSKPIAVSLQKIHAILNSAKKDAVYKTEYQASSIKLAKHILELSLLLQTPAQHKRQNRMHLMMNSDTSKSLISALTDQSFRSKRAARICDQMRYLIRTIGLSPSIPQIDRLKLRIMSIGSPIIPWLFKYLLHISIFRETKSVIFFAQHVLLRAKIAKRRRDNIGITLNFLGEDILGEDAAEKRMTQLLLGIQKTKAHHISLKISAIYSQINLLNYEATRDILVQRLQTLFQKAIACPKTHRDGTRTTKTIFLDMETYSDLYLTVDAFTEALSPPEFQNYSAGIALQAYIPYSFDIQKNLTEWAINRVKNGGAPIKLRIVKGANHEMETITASQRNWPLPTFDTKAKTDANFKKMVIYGSQTIHVNAVRLGIGSHNIFDIAHAMILRAKYNTEAHIHFEMLEGMNPTLSHAINVITSSVWTYIPVVRPSEYPNAIAYLIRRLNENSGKDHFLRSLPTLTPGSSSWKKEVHRFNAAFSHMVSLYSKATKRLDRLHDPSAKPKRRTFENDAPTDWSLPENRRWIQVALDAEKTTQIAPIPLVINGRQTQSDLTEQGFDPSNPLAPRYTYHTATKSQINEAITTAETQQSRWASLPLSSRDDLLAVAANLFREQRSRLIAAIVSDVAKPVAEADLELNEAIDFIDYYRRSIQSLHSLNTPLQAKGPVVVASPWNFPVAIATGCISAALASGNTVIFKPAPEAVYAGWVLANLFWKAGIPRHVLQFVPCTDSPEGTLLIRDHRIANVMLTGGTDTAKLMIRERKGTGLIAETGGKNTIIVTAMADRDQAITHIVQSAFGYAGQKCSAASLVILEKELFYDRHFKHTLKDAAASLAVGSAWDPATKIGPLISPPSKHLKRAMSQLEVDETWLLKPTQHPDNPQLFTPGIKWDVTDQTFTQQTELFGPILGVMCAKDLDEAIYLANQTRYGLTAGLESLDEREHDRWKTQIQAGNLYINRPITGAIVNRQPFGGIKDSTFGYGHKAGGPDYLLPLLKGDPDATPEDKARIPAPIKAAIKQIEACLIDPDTKPLWTASLHSYLKWATPLTTGQPLGDVLGESNLYQHTPRPIYCVVHATDRFVDIARILAIATILDCPLNLSHHDHKLTQLFTDDVRAHWPKVSIYFEKESELVTQLARHKVKQLRVLSPATNYLAEAVSDIGCAIIDEPILAHGRLELPHYMVEKTVSTTTHRYGNIKLDAE